MTIHTAIVKSWHDGIVECSACKYHNLVTGELVPRDAIKNFELSHEGQVVDETALRTPR